jgi:succinate dehydrogenase / fumarate reductase, cytochrome b subunit
MALAAKDVVRPSPRALRVALLWQSAIGKKALMAVTGLVLFAYVLAHMLGNLQVFAGAAALDRYAALLHLSPQLLWTVRLILLAALLVHVVAGVQLAWAARLARPIGYGDFRPGASTVASRTMIWSGLLILGFVVFHVLDLTVGVANPDFREGEVFHNVLATFGRMGAVVAYVIAMVGLGFHLWHGLWSVFQSLGLSSRRAAPGIQRLAAAVAVILTVGFSAIPLAVLLGFLA